jgi:hypothetical protein
MNLGKAAKAVVAAAVTIYGVWRVPNTTADRAS